MLVIPVINCTDRKCVEGRLGVIKSLPCDWLHIDVADGEFTPHRSWGTPSEFQKLLEDFGVTGSLEVHLMVLRLENAADEWLRIGAKRVIVHIESFPNPESPRVQAVIEKCAEYGAEVMFALNPATDVSELFPYLEYVSSVQCLGVLPGPSGQKFDERVVEKIKALRERVTDLSIEVDGGVNLEIARNVKEAGADIITSATYIFESKDPQRAYENLTSL